MKFTRGPWAANLFLFVVAITLGTAVYSSILRQNPNVTGVALSSTSRSPASLEGAGDHAEVYQDDKMTELELGCIQKGWHKEISTPVKQLRIMGQFCEASGLTDTRIINRSNGFEATTFLLKEKKFSSDYIDLLPGKNQLVLTLTSDQGEHTLAELIVTRH